MKKDSGLHVISFGIALGAVWAISLFIMAILAINWQYGVSFIYGIGKLYVGYKPTFIGAGIGVIWGFLDGFVGGIVFAWLYNFFSRKLN